MTDDPDSEILVEVHKRVATLTLNRPATRNAFTLTMLDAWAGALTELRDDPAVGAVVVTGAGDGFCAGVDLAVLQGIEPTALARKRLLSRYVHQIARVLATLEKPVIAAVNGAAVGAGMDMALMCDMRFMADTARMAESYIRVGLIAGDGGAWLLPRLVGPAKAMELLLGAEFLAAAECERIGLVNRVYPAGDLLERTREFAAKIAAAPPLAVAFMKRSIRQSPDMPFDAHLDLASSHMSVLLGTADTQEAIAAFVERRPPVFHGR